VLIEPHHRRCMWPLSRITHSEVDIKITGVGSLHQVFEFEHHQKHHLQLRLHILFQLKASPYLEISIKPTDISKAISYTGKEVKMANTRASLDSTYTISSCSTLKSPKAEIMVPRAESPMWLLGRLRSKKNHSQEGEEVKKTKKPLKKPVPPLEATSNMKLM